MALVETDPSDGCSIRIPCKGTVEGKLLLVNPIRNTIDNFIELTILGYLYFLLAIGNEDVIVLDESHVAGVWRPGSHLLVLTLRELLDGLRSNVVDEILSLERTAIHRLALGEDKHLLAIRTDDIAIYILHRRFDSIYVEEHSHLLTRLERITNNLLSVIADRSIEIGSLDRVDTGNV